MDVRGTLQQDLTGAMRSRDDRTVRVLRTVLSAIANAEAVPVATTGYEPVVGLGAGDVPRRELSAEQTEAILTAEIDERQRVADDLRTHGRNEHADELEAEIAIVARYRHWAE